MQLFYEILPVFLFFMAFKFYDIYVATVVGIISTLITCLISRLSSGKWDKKQVITLCVFLFFGGMTLYFHDPIFVKWKPTIVFWIFSLIILCSQFFGKKTLAQRLMENVVNEKGKITVPNIIWKKLNLIWAMFFMVMGAINVYVAYQLSNDAWVNFKFYGITAALFLFSILQAIYLMRYLSESK